MRRHLLALVCASLGLACSSKSPSPASTGAALPVERSVSSNTPTDRRPSEGTEVATVESPPDCGAAWMVAWAAQHQGYSTECAPLDVGGGEPRDVVRVCEPQGHWATYLVEGDDGRWAIEHEGWGHVEVCGRSALVPGTPLTLADTGPGQIEIRRIGLVDGRPAVVEHVTNGEPSAQEHAPIGVRVADPANDAGPK